MKIKAETKDSRTVTQEIEGDNPEEIIRNFFKSPLAPNVRHTKTLRKAD